MQSILRHSPYITHHDRSVPDRNFVELDIKLRLDNYIIALFSLSIPIKSGYFIISFFFIAKFSPSPSEAGLSKLYNHGGTATATTTTTANRQSITKYTFRLCRKLKFSIGGVFNLISLISQQARHQLVSQKCFG